ncbi:hypothetical protein SAMN05444372_102184 [Flavobacterium micromati]|jgi:hypothetical protein|uniref:Uncharacterized protein n=1 Tax=Flavobacterium micromati TaxID=229205 RepID=A0A1M5GWD6_9FLAO|nr:hypothetical protein [Flavobacterium micromati]MCL6461582.1 hypothetical protein [Flavobacterium micromati]SHG08084.1 hypothetical protein SAMN05444372_102184 [Flavobacterium micromati]
MSLLNKIGKKMFFMIVTVLLIMTLINYSNFERFNVIRMNEFFSGFFAGTLLALLIAGMLNYTKIKNK